MDVAFGPQPCERLAQNRPRDQEAPRQLLFARQARIGRKGLRGEQLAQAVIGFFAQRSSLPLLHGLLSPKM
jgi:hypothetical protein